MNYIDFLAAVADCNLGLVPRNGATRAFLFNGKWYPLKPVVNCARLLGGFPIAQTTQEAQTIFLLCDDLGYVKVRNIVFINDFPIEQTINEKINEIKDLGNKLQAAIQLI